jgi:replicative DNA helicase
VTAQKSTPVDPHAIRATARFEVESGLLGALLGNGDQVTYDSVAAIVGPKHFNDAFNAALFDLIGQGFGDGLQGFPLNAWVIGKLQGRPELAELQITASALVSRLVAVSCPAIGVQGSARQVRYDWLQDHLKQSVEQGDVSAAQSIAAEMEAISRAHLGGERSVVSISTAVDEALDSANNLLVNGFTEDGAWAGSNDLHDVIGGFRPGRYYVIAGRPGMGKSTAALSLLRQSATRGHGVMIFSLEMTTQELTDMALCDTVFSSRHRVEYRDLRSRKIENLRLSGAFKEMLDSREFLADCPISISDKPGQSIAEIRIAAMQYRKKLQAEGRDLKVICIDHLNLLKPDSRYAGNKVAETEQISGALKILAKELACAVVCLVQLNRGVEGREDKRPALSDLRWSGAIEQDADVVMFIYREAYYLQKPLDDPADEIVREDKLRESKNKLEIIIAKHRGGPTPVLTLFCDMGCGVVRDMAG